MQKEERLRRKNLLAHETLMAKQRVQQSGSIGNFPASKPVEDASHALVDHQSTKANQPEGSNIPPNDPQAKVDSVTPKFRPHPTYNPSVHHPNTISIPRSDPHDTPSYLMPIRGSSTQVQSNEPNPSTTMASAGKDDPPTMTVSTGQHGSSTTNITAGQDNSTAINTATDQDTSPTTTNVTASASTGDAKVHTPIAGEVISPSGRPPPSLILSPTFKVKAIPRFQNILAGEAEKRAQAKKP